MSLVADRPVLIQGITGRAAGAHAELMREYGTDVVAGVTPGRGGGTVAGVPIFNTVADAVDATGATASVAFLPPPAVGDGMIEAAEAGVEALISVTEGVPAHDVTRALEAAQCHGMRILGPNSPGMARVGKWVMGFLPVGVAEPGRTAVISRSGTLSYEVVFAMTSAGLGVSTWVGIGGDRLKGTRFLDLIPELEADETTDSVVIVGEIGGTDEQDGAAALEGSSLRAVALLAGAAAPEGVALGHAGAIIESGKGGYADKRAALEAAGVRVLERPSEIPAALLDPAPRGTAP